MEKFVFPLVFIISISTVTSQEVEVTSHEDGVQNIEIAMCKNFLPYNLTKLPNEYGSETQIDVYRDIERLWPYFDYECSANMRLLACGSYLPRYDATSQQVQKPCKRVCSLARKKCLKIMRTTGQRWPRTFRCNRYPTQNCIEHKRERRGNDPTHPFCTSYPMAMCANLSITHGFLPNPYLQPSIEQVSTEILYFDRLVESGCSPNLRFMLCASFMPVCVPETGYVHSLPCKALCEQVYADCYDTYRNLYGNLPWPNKFQCHRFRDAESNDRCVMPGDF